VRVAFYAPLKPPTHVTPSGDRRVAGLLMDALERVADHVELVSTFRSFDADGDSARQEALRKQGAAHAEKLVRQWRAAPAAQRPDLWFTYHVYYKAPDWLGPAVSAALGIPYVIAEASYAQKRASGPWAIGHEAAAEAINRARLVISPSRDDLAGLHELVPKERIVHLAPFIDPEPYRVAAKARKKHREHLAGRHELDPAVPWIVVAAMMRKGDKLASYRALAAALARAMDLPWRLLVAGDGPARREVEAALQAAASGRVSFVGTLAPRELAEVYAAGEAPIVAADGRALARALRVAGAVEPVFIEDIAEMPEAIRRVARDGDVVLTMGAGSIGNVASQLA
jgi:glycosyltransferase involved in cell wall biosynthesis